MARASRTWPEDIAHRGLLQSLSVRPILDEAGAETGRYEVPAGGRRFRALEHLVKTKRMVKSVKVPCIVRAADSAISATEDSIAENAMREALHPLDQFRAFKALADAGMPMPTSPPGSSSPRPSCASACGSPGSARAAGGLRCERDDAGVPDGVLRHRGCRASGPGLEALNKRGNISTWSIRQALTESSVGIGDARAVFVGEEAYVAAGGGVLRDLFAERGDGWFRMPTS